MEYSTEHSLSIKLINTSEFKEVDVFLGILSKCSKEAKKAGFKSLFDKDEKAFITRLHEEFVDNGKSNQY